MTIRRFLLCVILALAPTAASAAFLYGVTATDLVVIDPVDPSSVRVIGPHGLSDRVAYLAWDPVAERLFGLETEDLSGGGPILLDYDLVEYDVATGAGSLVRNLGMSDTAGVYEVFEYVESEGSLVVSVGFSPGFLTSSFQTLDPDTGALVPLVDVGFDNDFGVYDDVRDILYVWDPNNTGRIQSVDLVGGGVTDLAASGTADRDGAFSEGDGGIFLYDQSTDELVNIQTTDGGAPLTRVPLGVVAGDEITGLAFTPVPEPGATALLLAGAALLAPWARRR